jgi:hypothetical protein|tara:strand:- start:382 stop:840 length:459 start_codon:yes stop_codon:yes gene_type:complete
MKNFKPDKILKRKKEEWLKLGGKLVTRIIEDAEKGISQEPEGSSFPAYTESYAIKKAAGKVLSVGADRQVSPPNLRLTGAMLGSISPQKATRDSVELIYREAEKVEGNAKKKRNVYGLNDKNWEFARGYINDIIENKITKFNRKKVVIEIDI